MSRPLVRNAVNGAWIDVFCKGGWKMKLDDGSYITLTSLNTKIRNETNTAWLEFYCPIAPPKTVTGGSVRSNRLVDSAGFLWGTGNVSGAFEDGSTNSNAWQKIKYTSGVEKDQYVNNIKQMDCRDALYIILKTGKVVVSGEYAKGLWATGVAGFSSGLNQSFLTEQTSAWEYNIGEGNVANIAQISGDGCILLNSGSAYAVGMNTSDYKAPFQGARSDREYGKLGAGDSGTPFQHGIDSKISVVSRWSRLRYSNDRVNNSEVLNGVVSFAKNSTGETFALRDDGKLFQAPYWYEYATPYANLTTPKTRSDSMFDLGIPFTESTPVFIHPGAVLEAANGNLYYPQREMHLSGDRFWDFKWVNTGINLNALGSKVKRIVGYSLQNKDSYSVAVSIFILLEDGRLLAAGENPYGWFGIGSTIKTVSLNAPQVINTDVADFDSYQDSSIVMKKDGKMWATGSNVYSRLGLGAGKTANVYYDWQQCVFKSI